MSLLTQPPLSIPTMGRIYGAGLKFAKQLLQNFNPTLSDARAKELAVRMYDQTKGDRRFRLSKRGAEYFAFLVDDDTGTTGLLISWRNWVGLTMIWDVPSTCLGSR